MRAAAIGVLAAFIAIFVAAAPSRADDGAAAFFQGKQIRFFTMGSPGGGYDAYMRTLGAYLGKKLGATVIPTNDTGAGGLVAMNRTITANPDGLTILLVGGEGLLTAQLYGQPGVNYDMRKQLWLARVSSEEKVVLLGRNRPSAASPRCRSRNVPCCGRAPARPTAMSTSPPSSATRSR